MPRATYQERPRDQLVSLKPWSQIECNTDPLGFMCIGQWNDTRLKEVDAKFVNNNIDFAVYNFNILVDYWKRQEMLVVVGCCPVTRA